MFDKIYSGMKSMSFFSLLIMTVISLSISYTVLSSNLKTNTETELKLASMLINASDNYESHPDFADIASRVSITNQNTEQEADDTQKTHSDNSCLLNDGRKLTVYPDTTKMHTDFFRLSFYCTIMMMLLYIICQFYSASLAKKILKPLKNFSLISATKNCIYPELNPLVKKITALNIEINHQIEKTKRQKLRLQAVSENMSEGLIVLDKNRDIISANESILSIFKCENSPVHQNIIFLTDNEDLHKGIENAYTGKKSSIISELSSKSYRFFFSPVYETENIIGVIILIIDISDEIKNIQIRREFSANVSHELKTPLTTILGYSQIINNGIAKKEDIMSFTQKIEKETSRLIILIDDIIKISKLDEGAEEEEQYPVNLKECAVETAQILEDRARKRNIEIIISGTDLFITANKRQIDELIFNLCDNAIKYNNDNGKIYINISENSFSVSDTGIGIPEEYHDRIFERFFRVDKSRSKTVNGTGLGLSIVKHIVICLNATIDIKSAPGKGTTFTVKFPESKI